LDADSLGKGITIDQHGRLRWTPTETHVGSHNIQILVTDVFGDTVTANFGVTVFRDEVAPAVNLIYLSQGQPQLNGSGLFQVQATDNVGVARLELWVDGNLVTLDTLGRASVPFVSVGDMNLVAYAYDLAGNRGEAVLVLPVIDPTDRQGPVVALRAVIDEDANGDGRDDDGLIATLAQVYGKVEADDLREYVLEIAPLNSQKYMVLKRGTNPVDGVLGELDPTILANGSYRLRLRAEDINGNVTAVETQVEISGNLKFGEFQLSFTDMELQIGKMPVTLVRTYDSLSRDNQGPDFGYGWRLEFRDAQVQYNTPRDWEYEELGIRTRGLQSGDRIYITLPGGKREGFTFVARSHPFIPRFKIPTFDPDPGVTTKLTVPGAFYRPNFGTTYGADKGSVNNMLIEDANGRVFNAGGMPWHPEDVGGLLLQTQEGVVFHVKNGKITEINQGTLTQDANTGYLDGDIRLDSEEKLFLTDTEIRSSLGHKITFERDKQGRIVAAIDPDGNKTLYSYDKNGDLVSMTDRMGNITRFEYHAQRPHYLDKIIDPLNRPYMRNEYDEWGRLTKVFDANGNAINMSFDPRNQVEIITDPLNYSTVNEYDKRGNLLKRTNPDGGIETWNYDDKNNVTRYVNQIGAVHQYQYDEKGRLIQEIDPLGRINRTVYRATGDNSEEIVNIDPLGNISTVKNDSDKLTWIDASGFVSVATRQETTINGVALVSNMQYDQNGRLTSYISRNGLKYVMTYDNRGLVVQEKVITTTYSNPLEFVTSFEYDKNGQLIKQINPDGSTYIYEYDSCKRLISETINGQTIQYKYNSVGHLVRKIYPDGTAEIYEYDALGQMLASTDRAGRTTRFTYDPMGRLLKTTYWDGSTVTSEYDLAGQLSTETDRTGTRYEYTYDLAGNLIRTADSEGNFSEMSYDLSNNLVSVIDSDGNNVRYEYDANGNITGVITNGRKEGYEHEPLKSSTQIDVLGNPTKAELNSTGLTSAIVDAEGRRTEYNYDELSRLTSIKDANGNVTRYEYDVHGRLKTITYPDGSQENYAYDERGIVNSVERTDGTSVEYLYDSQSIHVKSQSGMVKTYEYDTQGRLVSYQDGTHTAIRIYDEQGRLTKLIDINGYVLTYEYDEEGRLSKVVSGEHITEYTYDNLNRVVQLNDSHTGATSFSYDNNGQLVQIISSNGLVKQYHYDNVSRLVTSIEYLDNAGNLVFGQEYIRDLIGNVVEIRENNGRKISYEYDRSYRLVKEEISDPVSGIRTIQYTYDAAGNRVKREDSVEGTTIYSYDNMNRLLSEVINGDITSYTYDQRGNLVSKVSPSERTLYTWDDSNRLISVQQTDTNGNTIYSVIYQYDQHGMRTGKIENGVQTYFVLDYSGGDLLPVVRDEYDSNGRLLRSYTHAFTTAPLAQFESDSAQVLHYVSDRTNSTRSVLNQSGNQVAEYAYDAYGRILNQSGNTSVEYLYNGESYDASTGLQYLRARYLDVEVGRFISPDPYRGDVNDPISLHRYHYAGLNPVMNYDPTGYFSLTELLTSLVSKETLEKMKEGSLLAKAFKIAKFLDRWADGIFLVTFMATFVTYLAVANTIKYGAVQFTKKWKSKPPVKLINELEFEIRKIKESQFAPPTVDWDGLWGGAWTRGTWGGISEPRLVKEKEDQLKVRLAGKVKPAGNSPAGSTFYTEFNFNPLSIRVGASLDIPLVKKDNLEISLKLAGALGTAEGNASPGIGPTAVLEQMIELFFEAKVTLGEWAWKYPVPLASASRRYNLTTGYDELRLRSFAFDQKYRQVQGGGWVAK